MGVPTGGGQQLGQATGSIVINTSQLAQAQAQVQSASRGMTNALNSFGVSLSAVGVVQMGRAVVSAAQLYTAYQRQRVAAESLAGGQARLNSFLETYEAAVGGSVSQVEALESVTKLLSVGFADNAEELDKFARAIRGISIALGRSEDFVTQNLILELFSQRGQRLDQLGLQYDKVRARADELRAADRSLTQQMAYQQAVLEQAEDRFGQLADSAQGQKTEVEKLTDAWKDLRLEMGRTVSGTVEGGAGFFGSILNFFQESIKRTNDLLDQYEAEWMQRFGQRTTIGRVTPTRIEPTPRFDLDQLTAITEWARGVQDIERQAARDRLDATRQYEEQRTSTIRQYEQTIAREAQDFATQRARAEEDYAIGLQRMRRDIAQREASQLDDLERTIAEARSDAIERGAERQAALEERIAETRASANERIAEMERDFNRQRLRAQEDYRDKQLSAAGRLDAIALLELRKDRTRQLRDNQESFNERLAKERKNEEKRIAELGKAHEKQANDEARALQKRIDEANRAYQRQLEDARAADEQRLSDMAADFQLRKKREDEDRAIRLERLKQDHQAQLDEMARQHALDMERINLNAAEELAAHNEAFDEQMASLGEYHAGVLERQEAFQTDALKLYEQYLASQEAALARRILSQVAPSDSLNPSQFVNPLITPGVYSGTDGARATRTGPVTINVYGAPGQDEERIAEIVVRLLESA